MKKYLKNSIKKELINTLIDTLLISFLLLFFILLLSLLNAPFWLIATTSFLIGFLSAKFLKQFRKIFKFFYPKNAF